MSRVYCYRNGILEVIKDFNLFVMRYSRNNNKIVRFYKEDLNTSLQKFKKVIDTEGF